MCNFKVFFTLPVKKAKPLGKLVINGCWLPLVNAF